MPKTTSPDPDLDELPGFAQSEEPPAMDLPDDELLDESSQSQDQPTTSPSPSPPASEPGSSTTPLPSTTTSTEEREPDLELTDGLEYLAGGLFELVGQMLNRMARVRRRGQPTSLWIVTDEEAERFAAPIARIADRHLPTELRSGDARDVVIAGSVAMDYGLHNAAGVPGVEEPAPAGPTVRDAEAVRQQQEAAQAAAAAAARTAEPTPGAAAPEAPPLVGPDI